ncbi:MAG: hypothetical protein M1816_004177 [Peltula sp. TS41687]|nr:MAG: hypothetical protein M1816_004177 [Peltula sp. TS41687]
MATSNIFFTSASPVAVLSPPSPHHSFPSSSDSRFASQPFFRRTSTSFNPWPHSYSFTSPSARQRDASHSTTINSIPRGRKRGRDEEDTEFGDGMVTPSTLRPGSVNSESMMMMAQPDKPPMQPGMMQRNGIGNGVPQSFFPNVNNDTGPNRAIIPRRKVQRLHTTPSIITQPSPTQSKNTDAPIDTFTLRFGIGWTNLNHQADKQAALRGWARYIEKNFPGLTNAQMLLQSKRLDDAFLVRTDQGYFLFDEEMSRGRLIARTEERALMNLTTATAVYGGGAAAAASGATGVGVVFDGEELVRGARVAVGADMMAPEDDVSARATLPRLQGEIVQISAMPSSPTFMMMDNVALVENANGHTNGDGNVSLTTTTTSTMTTTTAAVGAMMDLD